MGAGDTGSGGKKQRRVNHQPGHGAGQRQPWPLPSSPGGRRARVAPGTVLRQEDQVWGTLTLPWKASPHQGHPRELRSDTPPAGQRDRVGGWGGGADGSGGSQKEACGNDKGRVTAICSGHTGHSLGFCLWPWDTDKTTSTGSSETGQTATWAPCSTPSSLVVHAEHCV